MTDLISTTYTMKRIFIPLALLLTLACAPAFAGFEEDLADTGKAESSQPFRDLKARAEAGDADAQLNIGGLYFKGEGVKRDFAEAARWFQKAAMQRHPQAQFNLGMMYATGQGLTQNPEEAAKWYRLSAEQGLAVAQLNLGVAYFLGQGLPRSESEAVKWLRLAVNQGDAQAQFNLAVMYANGQGVPQDLNESYRLAGLAEAQGHATARALRADLRARMTPAQLAEATRQQSAEAAAQPAPIQAAAQPTPPRPATRPQPPRPAKAASAPLPAAAAQAEPPVPATANATDEPVQGEPKKAEPIQDAAAPDASASRPDDSARTEASAAPASAAEPVHARHAAPTARHSADDGKFYLQLSALHSEQDANKFIAEASRKLGKLGRTLTIYSTDNWVRVHLGPYPDAAAARHAAQRLRKQYGYDSIVKRH